MSFYALAANAFKVWLLAWLFVVMTFAQAVDAARGETAAGLPPVPELPGGYWRVNTFMDDSTVEDALFSSRVDMSRLESAEPSDPCLTAEVVKSEKGRPTKTKRSAKLALSAQDCKEYQAFFLTVKFKGGKSIQYRTPPFWVINSGGSAMLKINDTRYSPKSEVRALKKKQDFQVRESKELGDKLNKLALQVQELQSAVNLMSKTDAGQMHQYTDSRIQSVMESLAALGQKQEALVKRQEQSEAELGILRKQLKENSEVLFSDIKGVRKDARCRVFYQNQDWLYNPELREKAQKFNCLSAAEAGKNGR